MDEEVYSEAGMPLAVSYGPTDLPAAEALPPPGEFPFTRGNFPRGYRGRLWTSGSTRGSAPRRSPTSATATCWPRAAPDCPSRSICRPSAATTPTILTCEEEVGRVGVALDTLADAEILFDQIPLDAVSTSFTINGTAAILLAFYVAAGEKQGVAAREAARHDPERHPQGVREPRARGSGHRARRCG